jgi:hypothetical protein
MKGDRATDGLLFEGSQFFQDEWFVDVTSLLHVIGPIVCGSWTLYKLVSLVNVSRDLRRLTFGTDNGPSVSVAW